MTGKSENFMYDADIIEEISSLLFSDDSLDISHMIDKLKSYLGISSRECERLLYKILLYINLSMFPHITKMDLILTTKCNLACKYCFEKNILGSGVMDIEVAKSAIDLILDYSATKSHLDICYLGGEPTLNFDAIKTITKYAEEKAAIRNKSIKFNMTSNGTLLNEEMVNFFLLHKIKVLLSIDGLEESHDRFRIDKSGKGTFKKVIKGVQLLKKVQPWIGTKMTVSPENVDNLYYDVVELYKIGVNHFIIGRADGAKWSLNELERYIEQLQKLHIWYRNSSYNDIKLGGDMIVDNQDELKNDNFFVCEAGNNSICVDVNGEISPCAKVLSLNDTKLISKLGDTKFGIYNLNNRSDLVSGLKLRSSCLDRGIENDFRGGCYASNYEENQDIFQPNMQDYIFSKMK